jgi:hypothetical protein
MVQPERSGVAVFDLSTVSIYHWIWPLSGVAPWTTEPGKQLVGANMCYTPEEVAELGGEDAAYAGILARSEELLPGFSAAIVDSVNHSTARGETPWMSPLSIGPKIPRTIGSVEGLWFVGDGSEPCRGIWSEAAASCGILGARAMLKAGSAGTL